MSYYEVLLIAYIWSAKCACACHAVSLCHPVVHTVYTSGRCSLPITVSRWFCKKSFVASSGSAQLIVEVAMVAEAAAKKHEDNKCSLVDSGCASQLVECLRTEEVSQSSSAVQAVCACLKSLTTADDPKPAASRYLCPCSQFFASVSGCDFCTCCICFCLQTSQSACCLGRLSLRHICGFAASCVQHVQQMVFV